MRIATRAQTLPRSGIRRIMEASRGLPDVIHLEVGEPDFETPAHVVAAAHEAARAGVTRYTANAGLPGLRDAVAARASRRLGRDVRPEEVVVTPGAVAGIAYAIFALLDPGDEVLLPDPGWPNYASAVHLAGGRPVPYPLVAERGFAPDLAALEGRITARTRVLLVNTPGNPTGTVLAPDTVRALVDLAREHALAIVSDEVYEDIVLDGEHVSPARFDEDVVVVSGVSKTYAMTGWRIGFVIAPPHVAATLAAIQEPFASCASSVSQAAAEAALRGPQEAVTAMLRAYRERRDLVVSRLEAPGLLAARPTGAFYALVRVPRGADPADPAMSLLREHRVAVAPGDTFGEGGRPYVRISFATEARLLDEGLRRLVAADRAG
jgi:aspartate/methionine/tyrosine aminotransferase